MRKQMIVRRCLAVVLSLAVFSACRTEQKDDDWVGLPAIPSIRAQEFMLGVDISSVIALEYTGVRFFDTNGDEECLLQILADGGANWARIRVWNDPWLDPPGVNGGGIGSVEGPYRRGFGGGNNDLDRAIEIGERATKAGMRVLVNFHYSDFWADPRRQRSPRDWKGMSTNDRAWAIYDFTYDAITRMLGEGINVGMVQIGNETNNGMAGVGAWADYNAGWLDGGRRGWNNLMPLFNAGSRAVIDAERSHHNRTNPGTAFSRQILIAVHKSIETNNPTSWYAFTQAASELQRARVPYDVFGISYYPFWHGTLENLQALMNHLSSTFNVDVAVFETAGPFTNISSDGSGINGGTASSNFTTQAADITNVAQRVEQVPNNRGVGLFLWEPAWITISPERVTGVDSLGRATGTTPNTRTHNIPLWNRHGSGWAAQYANAYDGANVGGTTADNSALFFHTGKPTPNWDILYQIRNKPFLSGRFSN